MLDKQEERKHLLKAGSTWDLEMNIRCKSVKSHVLCISHMHVTSGGLKCTDAIITCQ